MFTEEIKRDFYQALLDKNADYEELTDEVTTGLCVRFVTHMREVIKEVFEA